MSYARCVVFIGFAVLLSSVIAQENYIDPTSGAMYECSYSKYARPRPNFGQNLDACALHACNAYYYQDNIECLSAEILISDNDKAKFFEGTLNISDFDLNSTIRICEPQGCWTVDNDYRQGLATLRSYNGVGCVNSDYPIPYDVDSNGVIDLCGPKKKLNENIFPPSCQNPGIDNPVLVSVGRKFEYVVDYQVPGSKGITIARYYNSAEKQWKFNFEYLLSKQSEGEYELFYPYGGKEIFVSGLSNRNLAHSLQESEEDIIVRLGNLTLEFDKSLKLAHILDGDVKTSFGWNDGSLSGIEFGVNGYVSITRDHHNAIKDINLVDDVLTYSWTLGVQSIKLLKVELNGQLITRYQYRYDDNLEEKIGADGIEDHYWTYDDYDRVIESGIDSEHKYQYKYLPDNLVSVKSPLSRITQYQFQSIGGALKLVNVEGEATENCSAASRYNSYYSNGTLQAQTDWEGYVTLYERDSKGRVKTKTEGLKWPGEPQYGIDADTSLLQTTPNTRVTQTCWHPTLNKPEKVIEPGRVVIYDYFPNGQLKTQKIEMLSSDSNCT